MKKLIGIGLTLAAGMAARAAATNEAVNLALFATPATSFVSGHETLAAINDGFEPRNVGDHSHGCYGNWPQSGRQWVQLEWSQPVTTHQVAVYWWDDTRGVRLPVASQLLFWNGKEFEPVKNASGLGVAGGRWNETTFDAVTTTKLRLTMDGREKFSTGLIEWKVFDAGSSPKFAPQVEAGGDRVVVLPAKTFLTGWTRGATDGVLWSRILGPGRATFGDAHALATTAEFTRPGDYELELAAANGKLTGRDTLKVRVVEAPTAPHLLPVATAPYKLDSTFWNERIKMQIVHWIPHCIAKLSEPGLKEGGFENFVEAAKKNAGQPHQPHFGPPWANAYTLNTIEAMCLAQLVEPQGDAELQKAQKEIRAKLEEWIPIVLAAQEADGYLQTRFTLGNAHEQQKAPPRWTYVGDHEGYVAGYFIEAAIAHFWMTNGKDRRLYDAAKKLADCWDAHIGPEPKQKWYDGHEEIEQALIRFAQLVNFAEGEGKGAKYIKLAKFLLDCRGHGESYDQTHAPVTQQVEALGHAVRAAYCYAAMTGIAMETGDAEYHSAVQSLWQNLVNTKYYVTGGIGSGETSEGFGKNYSLPNNAYSEACSDCGELFFQHNMNLAYRESRYADLMEETLYNAILGSVDLPAKNFTYTNPLDQNFVRYAWHACPCCVGNIPRVLLMLPTWMYAKDAEGLFVNLFIGGTVNVGPVAGTDVEIVQRTAFPLDGKVELVIKPAQTKKFTLHVRVPERNVSALYRAEPASGGIKALAVNGKEIAAQFSGGYAEIAREWKTGDVVSFELPLCVQRVKADERIVADRGRVALRYGPLIFNIESVDQSLEKLLPGNADLAARFDEKLLGGVLTISGKFADGAPLLAIPNYARNHRGGRSVVWIKDAVEEKPAPKK